MMSFDETRPEVEGTIVHALHSDYQESESIYSVLGRYDINVGAIGFMGKLGLAGGTIAFNSTKIPLATMPAVALETLQYSDNSTAAGLATGAAYGVWTLLTTGFADSALKSIPDTKYWLTHRHPTQVEAIIDSFPGLETTGDEKKDSSKWYSRMGKSILTHGVRGLTAVGVGANTYVLAAHLDELPKPAINRLRGSLAVDGGVVMGMIAGASAEVVKQIGDTNPALAEHIHDYGTNPWIAPAVGVTIMAIQGTKKQLTKRRQKAQALAEQVSAVQEFAKVD